MDFHKQKIQCVGLAKQLRQWYKECRSKKNIDLNVLSNEHWGVIFKDEEWSAIHRTIPNIYIY